MEGFVYIAGQYRKPGGAHDHTAYFEIEERINKAREWAAKFARAGIPFICPHLNSAHFEVITPDVPAEFWLKQDLEILAPAKAIFLMPGWEDSSGACGEYAFADNQEIPYFWSFEVLRHWWFDES